MIPDSTDHRAHAAALRAAALTALVLAVFHRSWLGALALAIHEPEAMHVWLAPLLIAAILWRRRASLRAMATDGSPWGLALIAASLALLALGAAWWWPEYLGRVALVPALAGAIAAAAGWRAAAGCAPALLLVWLMIPPGSSYLPFFIVVNDAYTPSIARLAIKLPPGPVADFRIDDLLAHRTSEAMLLLGSLSAAVAAVTVRTRSNRQIVTIAILALPVATVCHMVRTAAWVVLASHGWRGSGLLTARSLTAAGALALAFGMFFLAARIVRTIPPEPGTPGIPGTPGTPDGGA